MCHCESVSKNQQQQIEKKTPKYNFIKGKFFEIEKNKRKREKKFFFGCDPK